MNSLGVIVAVDGDIATVGMYNMSNDSTFLWDGDLLNGPKVGAFLTIEQNDIRIISKVVSEKIQDQQNTVNSVQFDNRYRKNSINRILLLKTQGVIDKKKFELTSQYVPMVGNKVVLTTKEDLSAIYAIDDETATICIGKSVREGQKVKLPIDEFFPSHIGIFGNTGSGKSNTLHKLYLELFRSNYKEEILSKSKFFVIDFNGEYTQDNQFGLTKDERKVFKINTGGKTDKIPITKEYFLDPEFLSLLFSARKATQVPFLKNAIRTFENLNNPPTGGQLSNLPTSDDSKNFARLEIGLFKKLLKNFKTVPFFNIEDWAEITQEMGINNDFLEKIIKCKNHNEFGNIKLKVDIDGSGRTSNWTSSENLIFQDGQLTDTGENVLLSVQNDIEVNYNEKSIFEKLKYFLKYQKIFKTAWNSFNAEHINPLFGRIDQTLESLEPLIEIEDSEDKVEAKFKCLNVFSLIDIDDQDVKRLMPMMISKMLYEIQMKRVNDEKKVNFTCHLIIDEAHNILNPEHTDNTDSWQDYRLSVFEDIIKEGRKFGFYLTLASQRPADISPTIMSQIHNFFIHRLVNDHDLDMLSRTVPTLDKNSYKMMPTLSKGEALITGNAMKIPMLLKVDKEEMIRPKSDDVKLTELWKS